jgi:5-formyltetrahydrofolate cyclo-ligase
MISKDEIRSSHRRARAALSPAAVDAAGEALARHGVAWAAGLADGKGTFVAYLGVGSEPHTHALLAALHGSGYRVLLPVCEPDLELSWVYWSPATEFIRSRYAPIQEPAGERLGTSVVLGATGIFLPATALDLSGNRIGQGGGYYDKFLASLRTLRRQAAGTAAGQLPTAALVYDAEVLPAGSIPAEVFDQKVDNALTPGGLIGLRQES